MRASTTHPGLLTLQEALRLAFEDAMSSRPGADPAPQAATPQTAQTPNKRMRKVLTSIALRLFARDESPGTRGLCNLTLTIEHGTVKLWDVAQAIWQLGYEGSDEELLNATEIPLEYLNGRQIAYLRGLADSTLIPARCVGGEHPPCRRGTQRIPVTAIHSALTCACGGTLYFDHFHDRLKLTA